MYAFKEVGCTSRVLLKWFACQRNLGEGIRLSFAHMGLW